MRSDRTACVLLRLYPRAWRARYGDEFLALVEDQGLSWRGVADVVAAAGVERARSIAAAVRTLDAPPSSTLEPVTTLREWIATRALILAFAGLAVLTLGAVGVPYPRGGMLAQFVINVLLLDLQLDSQARLADRVARPLYQFTAAAIVTGVCWLVAFVLTAMGAPPPSERVFFLAVLPALGWAGVRFLYRVFRPAYRAFRRPGEAVPLPPISTFEVRAWSFIMFTVVVTMAMMDPQGQTYWAMAFTVWIFLRFRDHRRARVGNWSREQSD